MRRLEFWCAVFGAVVLACANPNAPPGGPEDKLAPHFVKITPSNNTIGAKPKNVVFQFDEVVNETPKGAATIKDLVFVSPKSGDPSVSWKRSSIEIKPKKGWKPNTVYTVVLGAGVQDLYNNSIDSTTRLVFSTGGPIPQTRMDGVVFDWAAGRPAAKAIVEMIATDSTTYQTISDSIGRYVIEHVPPGPYTMRAFVDRNTNRNYDALEPFDTASVTFVGRQTAEFYAFSHDTIGLRIAAVTPIDSNTRIKVTFDRPMSLNPPNFRQVKLQRADSTVLDIIAVFSATQRAEFDSITRKAKADSAAAATKAPVDTSPAARARRDSVERKRLQDSTVAAERAEREARRLAALRGGRPLPPRDTTPPPKMKRPPLFTELFLTLARPLEPNTIYRIAFTDIRSISGTQKSPPSRTFRTAPRAANPDSAAAATKPPPGKNQE